MNDGTTRCAHGNPTEERIIDGWRRTFATGCSVCQGAEVKPPFFLPGDRPDPPGPACPTFRNTREEEDVDGEDQQD